jgi:hypothetical protein
MPTGGVCAEFTVPDPSLYNLLTVGGVTSPATGPTTGSSRGGGGSSGGRGSLSSLPWLQLEYEGPRALDDLHCSIQVGTFSAQLNRFLPARLVFPLEAKPRKKTIACRLRIVTTLYVHSTQFFFGSKCRIFLILAKMCAATGPFLF